MGSDYTQYYLRYRVRTTRLDAGPNLRLAVRETLDLTSDQPFTRADLLQLDWLDPYEMGIQDLRGIEHATNLRWFSFARNDVSDLSPLANLTKLRTLLGWKNPRLTDISPLANLRQLETLNLCEVLGSLP